MRVQLIRPPTSGRAAAALLLALVGHGSPGHADDGEIEAYSTLYYEAGGPLNNLIIDPHVGGPRRPGGRAVDHARAGTRTS